MASRPSAPMLAAATAFFASGCAALVYQVAWQRILALETGVGIYSIALIVARADLRDAAHLRRREGSRWGRGFR